MFDIIKGKRGLRASNLGKKVLKIKKGRLVVLVTVFFLIGASIGGALVYHINDAAEALKAEYKDRIDDYQKDKELLLRNDTMDITQQQIERMRAETEEYLQQQLNADYNRSLNEKSDEILQITDEKIEEIKRYIDEQLKAD